MDVDGEGVGRWQVAVALATPAAWCEHRLYAIETLFTSTPSIVKIGGAPISSLMIDPVSRSYYSEMTYADRPDSIFLKQSLQDLFRYL